MTHRYKVQIFSSVEGDSQTAEGTIVQADDRSFFMHAANAEDAETRIRHDVMKSRPALGRVYQICPLLGNPEPIRALAISAEGVAQRAYLDAAYDFYSEFRRIRYQDLRKTSREVVEMEVQTAS